MPRPRCLLLVLLASALLAGCGGGDELNTAPAGGKVLYNGEPLPYGTVSFRPEAGPPATGEIQSDGSFTLTTYSEGDGAIIGQHDVSIRATEEDAGTAPPQDPNEEPLPAKSVIPEKYSSFSTSGFDAEVTSGGENNFTFELSD